MATRVSNTTVKPLWADLRRRSKGGCIDCKSSKVRCDEVRPSCGTCARRRRPCRGYKPLSSTGSNSAEDKQKFIFYHPKGERRRQPEENASRARLDTQSPASETTGVENTVGEGGDGSSPGGSIISIQRDIESPSNGCEPFWPPESTGVDPRMWCESIGPLPSIPQSPSIIPPDTIPPDDTEILRLYFTRHPFEQVISLEFVDEMNASTWMVFLDNPQAATHALCSIGSVYLEEDSHGALLPMTVAKRARTLAALKVKDPSRELEQMLLMSLALGAMEVIDLDAPSFPQTFFYFVFFFFFWLKHQTGNEHEMPASRAYIVPPHGVCSIDYQQVY